MYQTKEFESMISECETFAKTLQFNPDIATLLRILCPKGFSRGETITRF